MRTFTEDEVKQRREDILRLMRSSVFIYPSDSLYCFGCNAMVSKPVKRLRDIKSNLNRAFSIIPPSKEWIYENCVVSKEAQAWVEKMPGPYVLMLPLKNPSVVDPEVLLGDKNIGVRIPQHWIAQLVADFGYPIVLTSANLVGQSAIASPDDIPAEFENTIDFFIDAGELAGKPISVQHFAGKK